MTTTTFPRIWSSNTNYSAGPDVGTPTKVDPGSALAAEGFEPGPVDAQHVNYLLNSFTVAQMRTLVLQALKLRGPKFTYASDTTQSLAAVQRGRANPLLVMKINGAIKLEDSDMVDLSGGTYSTLTTSVTGAAFGDVVSVGNTLVAIGGGATVNDYSLDGAATWAAGSSGIGGAVEFLVYSAVYGGFLAGGSGGGNVYRTLDPTATSWTASGGTVTPAGIAVLSSGRIILLSNTTSGGVHFTKSTNNGSTFSATAGTIHDAGLVSTVGSLVGNGGSLIYHAVVHNGIQISSSPDGDVWTVLTTLPAPAGSSFPSGCRIMMCQNTGLLVVAATTNSLVGGDSGTTFYGSLDGVNWFGPSYSTPFVALTSFAVSGGRLIGCQSKSIYVSDGIDF